MIYSKKYLRIKLLIENVCDHALKGIYRPQAYIQGAKGYCTECQIELLKNPLEPGRSEVINAVLLSPVGFGDHLKEGALMTLKNGLDVEAKAVLLEIMNQ